MGTLRLRCFNLAILLAALFNLFPCKVAALEGTVQPVTFQGNVTGKPVKLSLYLPPGYQGSTNRYPLVIHLHGINGTHNGQQTNLVPASLESAVTLGLIEPCIIAFPDGYTNSFWANSQNSDKPAETNIREEIIPYLDANYRTVGTRNRRVIQGFSMGGFGAGKFATKFPELFAACVIYDGAMLTWSQVQSRHPSESAELFSNDGNLFNIYSPWHHLTNNVTNIREQVPFRISVGSLLNENRAWRDALQAQTVTTEYVETGLPHSLGQLLDAQGSNSWAFIQAAFNAADTRGGSLEIAREGNNIALNWAALPGQRFQVEQLPTLAATHNWQLIATNIQATSNTVQFVQSNALLSPSGFYRIARLPEATNATPPFTFTWTGTNFTYSDTDRSFTGIMLKPAGEGPFPAVIINHGAGGSASGYSLGKAREMVPWGMIAIAPNLSHVAGGETNPALMGHCPENLERIKACLAVLRARADIDTNRVAIFGHSMGAFATLGSIPSIGGSLRAGTITSGGVIADAAGTTNATPTITEATPPTVPFLMLHCDADPVVPPTRSQLYEQMLSSNPAPFLRILLSSNNIPNPAHWHNIHQDSNVNGIILTNTRSWFQSQGVLP